MAGTKKAPDRAAIPGGEYVTVKLFWDGEKYKDDVPIGINGKFILIKRGIPVKIRKDYALVLEQSLSQDDLTKALIMGYSDEYDKMVRELA